MFECIQRFLIRPLYVNFTACTTLIVELQDASVYLNKVECATLLALLANTGNWLAKHRTKNRQQLSAEAFQKNTFPVILLLRDFAEYRLLVSMYTRNGLVWRNRQNWEDIFRWDLPIMHKGKQLEIGIEKMKFKKWSAYLFMIFIVLSNKYIKIKRGFLGEANEQKILGRCL